jgi:HK97 family phage major capsid protein
VPDTLVAQLTDKVDAKRSLIDLLAQRAADKGEDLSDSDMATVAEAQSQIRAWNAQLETLTADLELSEDAANRLRSVGRSGAISSPDFKYRSDGELLWDVLHQNDRDAHARYGRIMRRAAEHMGTVAAQTTPTAGDLAGLVVQNVVGPVINPYSSGMPLVTAIGYRAIPASDGFGFSRPQVVDANLATGVGVQALEKAELASKAFSVTTTAVTMQTIGGYLNISQQLLSFNPSSLGIILDQLRIRLEEALEVAAAAAITAGSTLVTTSDTATADVILKAIYTAASAYYVKTKSMPTWLAMGPAGWARLGGLTDLAGRPMFPTLGASNAPGTAAATQFSMTVAGLQAVVSPAITGDGFFVGGPAAIEGYLFRYPILEAVEPSVLGRQVAVAVEAGTHKPPAFVGAIQRIDAA